MTQKNTTAIERGAMLAKLQINRQMAEGRANPPTLAMLLRGNRAQRRAAQKQLRKARKAERERCADIAESYTGKQGEHDGTAIANIIRELGDE